MSDNRIEIRTVQDIANLTPDQREGFLVDLNEWLRLVDLMRDLAKVLPSDVMELTMPEDVIHWVDDGDYGRCSEININAKIAKKMDGEHE